LYWSGDLPGLIPNAERTREAESTNDDGLARISHTPEGLRNAYSDFSGWRTGGAEVRGAEVRDLDISFSGLRGSMGCVACGSRRGGACQAGEARASAAMASRIAARPHSRATGQADAMAILMRRALMRTSA